MATSTGFYTMAARMRREVDDAVRQRVNAMQRDLACEVTLDEYHAVRQEEEQKALDHFRSTTALSLLLQQEYATLAASAGIGHIAGTFVITVRPRPGVTWETFHGFTKSFVARKCFVKLVLSFEQKAQCHPYEGWHFHAVVGTTHKYKSSLLQNILPAICKVADEQCVQVDFLRGTAREYVQHYLVHYASKDGHKILTRKADLAWRSLNKLKLVIKDDENAWKCADLQKDYESPEINHSPIKSERRVIVF